MEGPGSSIFQGESIKFDTNLNRLEEEEALEDQKRRDEELGNQLANAFDDLIAEDEYTVDSSSHFPNMQEDSKCFPQSSYSNLEFISTKNKTVKQIDENEYLDMITKIQNLKKNLESKSRESQTISKIMKEETKKNEELKKHLAIVEAEKCRTEMMNKQTHELLVESKMKISELEDTISKQNEKIQSLETNNNELKVKLECVQTALADTQQKYMMVEKNAGLNSDRNNEALFKQMNERYKGQIDMMAQQIDSLRAKLNDKDNEINVLDIKYKELQRNRETLLIEKSEQINRLVQSLEESQKQCQKLMEKEDHAQENIRLQRLVTSLERQNADMQKTMNNLTTQLDSTKVQLDLMNSVLNECSDKNENGARCFSFNMGTFPENTPITDIPLKNELQRCIISQKAKRDEIRKLQEQLTYKNEEIKKLKDEENAALVQINTYKEKNMHLESKVKILEEELKGIEENRKDLSKEKNFHKDSEIEELCKENQLLKEKLENLQYEFEISHLVEIRDQEQKKLKTEMENLKIDLEEIKQENENLRSNYKILVEQNETLEESNEALKLELEKQKFLVKNSQNECDRLKNLYVEVSNSKEAFVIELEKLKSSDLYKENQEQRQRNISLENALKLAEIKASELEKLLEIERMTHRDELNQLNEKLEKGKYIFPDENFYKKYLYYLQKHA